ncbi:MAG TPA: hypothetical protein HPP76_00470 [Desulfuromonadales bacterium]|nr:hypothetical protein [Desulfuromonadales bacterium]
MIWTRIISVVLTVATMGCAHVMSETGLKLADRSIRYEQLKKNPDALVGKLALTGGVIVGTRSSGDMLFLEVAQLELFANGVPDESSLSGGRFLAVSSELLDPVIYRPGRFVTIIGEIKGRKIQKLESVDYPYPLISVKEIRLFRASEPFATYPNNPYQSRVDDGKLMLRPPGPSEGEPRRLY